MKLGSVLCGLLQIHDDVCLAIMDLLGDESPGTRRIAQMSTMMALATTVAGASLFFLFWPMDRNPPKALWVIWGIAGAAYRAVLDKRMIKAAARGPAQRPREQWRLLAMLYLGSSFIVPFIVALLKIRPE